MNDIPKPVDRSGYVLDGTEERKTVRDLVDRAIRAVIPPGQQVERRTRPESTYSWQEPSPLAGLHAALLVAETAQRKAYEFVLGLRSEGSATWQDVADLLGIEWSDQYARRERAYELVLGPAPEDASPWRERNLDWRCGGADGCGEYITDRGPYNGYPSDNEDGHAESCRRHAAEQEAYVRELELREERDRVADKAMNEIPEGFGKETVRRARHVLAHGGRYLGWSTSELLAVALVLRDDDELKRIGSSSRESALDRMFQGTPEPREGRAQWLATLRAAATGEND